MSIYPIFVLFHRGTDAHNNKGKITMDVIQNHSGPNVLLVTVGSSKLELNYARKVLNSDWSVNLFFSGNRKSISEHKQTMTKTLDTFPALQIVIVLIASEKKDILKHGLILSRIAKNRELVSVIVSQYTMESIMSSAKLRTYTDSFLLCPLRQENERWLLRYLGKKWIQKKNVYQGAKDILYILQKIETVTGFINLDSADICSVLKGSGNAYIWDDMVEQGNNSEWFSRMISQSGVPKERLITAAKILFWIAGPIDCDLKEFEHASRLLSEQFSSDTNILFGANFDEELSDKLHIGILMSEFRL